MAFVSEKLEGKDLEYVKSFGFKHPLSIRDEAILPETWVADHENNCYLICLGAGGWRSYETDEFPPSYYRLIVNNKVVDVEAKFKTKGNGKTGIKIWWKITNIVVTQELNVSADDIKKLIMDSFEVEGNDLHGNHIKETVFDLIAEPIFLAGGDK